MSIYWIHLISVFIYMNFWFLVATIKKRNDIADVVWGPGFALLALVSLLNIQTMRTRMVFIFVFIWGARLAMHIGRRFFNKKKEDFRYQKWRDEWGDSWLIRGWLKVFMLQGFFMILVALPIILLGSFDVDTWNLLNTLGILVWLIGFSFEVVSDRQLREFVKNKKEGEGIMKKGLWKYSRHPNYFGEVVLWWGIWLISLGSSFSYMGIIGPITISFLILKVSGIPMLEKKYEGNLEFEEYKRVTNAFFPWKPKDA